MPGRLDLAQEAGNGSVTGFLDLSEQAAAGRARKGIYALAQVAGEGIADGLTRL